MKLFFGSNQLIRVPTFGKGNPANDYGLGLYLTPEMDMARPWASKFPSGGFAITYDVDLSSLRVLNLANSGEEAILRWITLLVEHRFDRLQRARYQERVEELIRRYGMNLSQYDVIIGYRADDSYFRYATDFLANTLSIDVLAEAMKLGKLGTQVVLKSKEAFQKVSFVSAEEVPHDSRYERFRSFTLDQYHALKTTDSDKNTFIRDILRRGK